MVTPHSILRIFSFLLELNNVEGYMYVLCVEGGQKTIYESQFSPSTMWLLGMELRSSDLDTSVPVY